MIGRILKKEVSLSMHPIMPLMLVLSLMVFIPNYPYSVIFFYTTLGIFFTCLLGRENNDIIYSLNLPITKAEVVKGRLVFTVLLEAVDMALVGIFIAIKEGCFPQANAAGWDANLALLAMALVLFSVFNAVFFRSYYRDVTRVGASFLKATIIYFVAAGILEASTYFLPLVKNYLDTPDPQFLGAKLIFLALALLLFTLVNIITYKGCVLDFSRQDLQG